jgi:hypothetical protein
MFFFPGTFGNNIPVYRRTTIPEGKHVLIAILNSLWVSDPGDLCETLIEAASHDMDPYDPVSCPNGVSYMECTIDGIEEEDPWQYKETSGCFTVCFPPGNIFDVPPGRFEDGRFLATSGYWMMLEPLPPGKHIIHTRGIRGNPASPTFTLDVTCELTVEGTAYRFKRGDLNYDKAVGLSDAMEILSLLYTGSCPPRCEDAADANDSGDIDLADAIRILFRLFGGEGPLPPPGAEACGVDPTGDDLPDCANCCGL